MPSSHLTRMIIMLTAVGLVAIGFSQIKPPTTAVRSSDVPMSGDGLEVEPMENDGTEMAVISPIFTPEVQVWAADIERWAADYGLDPNLVATIMQIESCGNPTAVSPAGAQGLFQVMPYHFLPGEAMQNPVTNARRGLAYFVERLAQTGGDTRLSFAGYNGGHTAAAADWDAWLPETRAYVRWATGIYGDVLAGRTQSETLTQWLAAGGSHLCAQAASVMGVVSGTR